MADKHEIKTSEERGFERPRPAEKDQRREDVALFAAYCIGSGHGDESPLVDAEQAKVMSDDAAYAYWQRVRETYDTARSEGFGTACPADPFESDWDHPDIEDPRISWAGLIPLGSIRTIRFNGITKQVIAIAELAKDLKRQGRLSVETLVTEAEAGGLITEEIRERALQDAAKRIIFAIVDEDEGDPFEGWPTTPNGEGAEPMQNDHSELDGCGHGD